MQFLSDTGLALKAFLCTLPGVNQSSSEIL